MKHVGEIIQNLRKKSNLGGKKLSIRKLAELSGFSEGFIEKMEQSPILNPSTKSFIAICKILGTTPLAVIAQAVERDEVPAGLKKNFHKFKTKIFVLDGMMNDEDTRYAEEKILEFVPNITKDWKLRKLNQSPAKK